MNNTSVESIKTNVASIFDQYLVDKAAVFGSCARGEMKPESDVDIVISFLKPLGLFKFH